MEYTKGEWEVRKGELNTKEIFITCDKADIAKVFQQLPNAEANARLIVASPRMAELLERLVNDGWNASISEEAEEILQTLA